MHRPAEIKSKECDWKDPSPEYTAPPNVIIFGESGSGKSSLVNLIASSACAEVSSGATGCTFESKMYTVSFMGGTFNLYDTAGLDEGAAGAVSKQDAVVQLYKLLQSLSTGVSLLIFCMRGPRIKDSAPKNWGLFYEIMCQKKVPIVIAVTGLEQEGDMDAWWYRNKGAFQAYEMAPVGYACITATRGKKLKSGKCLFDEEYEESMVKMQKLIMAHHLVIPWQVTLVDWFTQVVDISYASRFCWKTKEHRDEWEVAGPGITKLMELCDMTEEMATELGERLRKSSGKNAEFVEE